MYVGVYCGELFTTTVGHTSPMKAALKASRGTLSGPDTNDENITSCVRKV